MKLTFRGQSYQRTEFAIEGYETRHTGTFLGTPYTLTSFQTDQPTMNVQLKYRGRSYVR